MTTCEHPILFNGAMVRAIQAGQKTQTRRVVAGVRGDNCLPLRKPTKTRCGVITHVLDAPERGLCPFGRPGDRLWVRETWRPSVIHCCFEGSCDCDSVGVTYAADGQWIPYGWQNGPDDDWTLPDAAARGNVPSIHMPRWACRLVLEITAVRVERLHAISDAGAVAEGIEEINGRFSHNGGKYECRTPSGAFVQLWESTGGDWDSNPWVWAISFLPVTA